MELTISIENLLKSVVSSENIGSKNHQLSLKLFDLLLNCNCDYFELMRVIARLEPQNYTLDELRILVSSVQSENITKINEITTNVVRSMISRWTATKYHSGPIDVVVDEIQKRITQKEIGFAVYNSNRNTVNRRAANDTYVLIITEEYASFLDLNLRRMYRYGYEISPKEETIYDKNGHL